MFTVAACQAALAALPVTDFAESRQAELWLRHPVYGDPSFDAFERVPGNPIHRGRPPYEWPVNGFLFADPVGGAWYLYVGDYCKGYAARASRCILYRSTDHGRRWEYLGPVLQGDPAMFDHGGSTPDVSVVFADGRYHMLYDWGEVKDWMRGGLAYAWAERPEGPFHRAAAPITENWTLSPLLGKYRRTYAGTLIRRRSDWLILGMMDSAPTSWAMFAMAAARPEGPYSPRQLVLNVESERFHPPLLEGFPAFAHDGYVYAPATSVALNRNFQVLFRAPLAGATESASWKICRYGSFWHAEDVAHEAYGLWGQTPACRVDSAGVLWAMFNSRDPQGMGTVNLARRPWHEPLRDRGFVLSGHQGPSLTCLRQAFGGFQLDAAMRLHGTARLLWDFDAPLGPDRVTADATLHPLMRTRQHAVEFSATQWKVLSVDAEGRTTTLAAGTVAPRSLWLLSLHRGPDGSTTFAANGQLLWTAHPNQGGEKSAATIGLLVEPHSHLGVERFRVAGEPLENKLSYLSTEGLLGAGEKPADWEDRRDWIFRYGVGAVSRRPCGRIKWNVVGTRMTLWSPGGPAFGKIEVRLDGRRQAVLDLHTAGPVASRPVWASGRLPDGGHAVVLQSISGVFPADCLETASGSLPKGFTR
jgi:hypothetical protein